MLDSIDHELYSDMTLEAAVHEIQSKSKPLSDPQASPSTQTPLGAPASSDNMNKIRKLDATSSRVTEFSETEVETFFSAFGAPLYFESNPCACDIHMICLIQMSHA